jgi:DEAD/DEAH box helicase domain-containing protein
VRKDAFISGIDGYLRALEDERELTSAVVYREDLAARGARTGALPQEISSTVRRGLAATGISGLYSHQSEAVSMVLKGQDTVVVTPTASGKTLCFNIPVVDHVFREKRSRALYLFPMKALEQDQLGTLREFVGACGLSDAVTAEIYDGDTTQHRRAKIRKSPPSVLLTNPDMLHMGILAYHEKWEEFFRGLRFVVIDEVHTYRGVFGSHMAGVLRRLLRICEHYGARPRIIACSATVSNPGELAARLTGREVKVVDSSGAPESRRRFLFLNPDRLAASTVAARLLRRAVDAGLATIAFTKSRRMTELIYTWAVQGDAGLGASISAYRAGYLPEERREIESALFSGELKGVISTSALEAGIDIGVLDVCILVGYPGTITTTWQRGGRVGRQDRDSLIIIVAGEDALDQYIMRHPRAFFDAAFEPAVVDPGNIPILKDQLVCAAAELPLAGEERWLAESGARRALEELAGSGKLVRSVEQDTWRSLRRFPQREVNIRGIGEGYTIFETGPERRDAGGGSRKPRAIGSLDGHRVFSEGHVGAIYLHRSRQYEITALDLEKKNLRARPVRASYYTQARRDKTTDILEVRRSRLVGNFVARLGDLKVTERVTGYEKKRIASGEKLSTHELDLPPSVFETVGFWVEIDDFVPASVARRGLNYMGGIHALEHAAIALFPLFALCEPDDIGGISIPLHHQVRKGAVFFYDGYPGGVGLCEQSYSSVEELLEKTWALIRECECENGCPSCIYSSKCGSGNVPLDKEAAVMVLELLLDKEGAREWMVDQGVSVRKHEGPEPPEEPEESPGGGDGPRVLVLDLETLRGADEVGGWGNAHLMGMALAVVWDSSARNFTTFLEEQAEELFNLLSKADLVVGFNLLGFDYRVLSAYDDGSLALLPTFDILQDVRKRLGFRLSLAHLAEKNLGAAKSADGLQSLAWVREGRMDLVEKYCRDDVRLTCDLFYHGLERKALCFEDREGHLLEIQVDWDLGTLVKQAREGILRKGRRHA